MARKIGILFFCLIGGIFSCKKDSSDYPSVQITSPYSLAIFNVPCTIQVTGHVSDAKSLSSVTVYIANSQNTPVEQIIHIPVTSNSMNVSCSYVLNDIHIPGGTYYMTITASNGSTIASAFQQIYVDALPVKRIAIYAITRDATGVHAWGIDSAFKTSNSYSYTVPGDYSSSDINSYYQQLYIAGHDSGNITISSVPNGTYSWSLVGSVSPQPCFTNVSCNNDAEFISCYNPACVKCYNHAGAIQAVYNIASGYYPVKTFLWGSMLFTEEKSIPLSGGENLLSFYATSTAGYEQNTLPGPVVAMYGYDNNDIFIFGNSAGTGYINLYNVPVNYYYSPVFSLSSYGKMLSAAQINANTYLLSFSNGTIYQYTYNPINLTPCITGIIASTIRYDSINNQVITASGKMVSIYNYANGSATLVNSITISDSVRDVRVLYNK